MSNSATACIRPPSNGFRCQLEYALDLGLESGLENRPVRQANSSAARPYGYHVDRDTHKLIPHPEEAPHLREIFRLFRGRTLWNTGHRR